jgi:acetolactate synthase-1/2/3 large subunit
MQNGAESVVRTLANAGIDVCFANPGTSEMQYVDALDRTRLMRCILGLFEGVVTGAADGYARMTGRPALSLLHLAPGLANACANLHNARKARTPMLTLIGDHAVRHLRYDAPLSGDVLGAVAPFADWTRTATSAAQLGADAAAALAAALSRGGQGAALISPADLGWDAGGVTAPAVAPMPAEAIDPAAVVAAARLLGPDMLLLCGQAAIESAESLALIEGIAAKTGATFMAPTSNRRIERGAGVSRVPRVPYDIDISLELLKRFRGAVLIGAQAPVAFFAYPGRPCTLLPAGCQIVELAHRGADAVAAVRMLADELGARPLVPADAARPLPPAAGPISPEALGAAFAAALPHGAIVVDEGVSGGRAVYGACDGAPPTTWIQLTGGAIGGGIPLAVGAGVACPDRPVIALQADGSAMYTIQGLWTQARENLNVTTVIIANRGYEILKGELGRVGVNPGRNALDLLEMARPEVDFVALARGMGVDGVRIDCARALTRAIADSAARPGPFLIEARIG